MAVRREQGAGLEVGSDADEVVDGDSLLDRALGEAEGMAALSARAFAKSKEALRSATAARVRAGLAEGLSEPPA